MLKKQKTNQELSEAAACAERLGQYEQAADLWSKSARFAVINKQREWCIHRSNFCYRVAEKPF